MGRSDIPAVILKCLQKIEPDASYSGTIPRIESSSGKRYFAKVGSASEKDQFFGEAESLNAIKKAAAGLAPQMFAWGLADSDGDEATSSQSNAKPYFLSEYKDFSGSLTDKAAQTLAKRLATEMHRSTSENGKFGFGVPTFCGATRQENGWSDTWEECYDKLIGGLLDGLGKKGRFTELCRKGEEVRKRVIPHLLRSLKIEPVILHGDLWSGNTGTDRVTGEPVIFDPSSYYGHNEADLAIARIFGGFPSSFYNTYHQNLPKSEPADQYELRADLYELYHYLNHTLLFGGSYAGSATHKMDRLLRECP
ncbi:fructosamine-3-kinase [Gloeophyllum trabeum ATCC 11539]|uniref:protein-ribulosamine 3-kinase n=1 Tax=Gloeophyllum trabeum (strain ATCC 11539 / FP-39264 / Madison 617) TaxID=670483 RepID=S7S3I7_GLOTA|nr:fructosamine-3-kinase [Gloeophyllum trabeum ATCC 11539]EPQ60399.1 fructosamine-3-kinase [Gloeophyllum trabeum ATCC 11539]